EVESLALKLKDGDSSAFVPGQGKGSSMAGSPGQISIRNQGVSAIARFLENQFGKQVVDRTGLAGRYDMVLQWESSADKEANNQSIKRALLEQLGVEVVSNREPMEMLVMERK